MPHPTDIPPRSRPRPLLLDTFCCQGAATGFGVTRTHHLGAQALTPGMGVAA
ncbi:MULTISPECIES: hypothetical protein [unclassified Streptomyces]|uniref:hypothetical protein n=1 Tax=unclassified Streptomyces TaxID=2593676 RepID=UPI0036A59994